MPKRTREVSLWHRTALNVRRILLRKMPKPFGSNGLIVPVLGLKNDGNLRPLQKKGMNGVQSHVMLEDPVHKTGLSTASMLAILREMALIQWELVVRSHIQIRPFGLEST